MSESKYYVTVQKARMRLGEKAKTMTDKEIEDLLKFLRFLCNKAIDATIAEKAKYAN